MSGRGGWKEQDRHQHRWDCWVRRQEFAFYPQSVCSSSSCLAFLSPASTLCFSPSGRTKAKRVQAVSALFCTSSVGEWCQYHRWALGREFGMYPPKARSERMASHYWKQLECWLLSVPPGWFQQLFTKTDPSSPASATVVQSQMWAVARVVQSTAGASTGHCKTSAVGAASCGYVIRCKWGALRDLQKKKSQKNHTTPKTYNCTADTMFSGISNSLASGL